jgi:hypothetical protein
MKKHKSERYFVRLFIDTMESPAWHDMSHVAQALYIAFKKRYNRKTQAAVFLSVRDAAKELNLNKDSIRGKHRELEHYGFIRRIKPARVGKHSGKAALYQLTDEAYEGKPPSMDFTFWNGVSFEQTVRDSRTQCTGFSDTSVRESRTLKKGNVKKARKINATESGKCTGFSDISRIYPSGRDGAGDEKQKSDQGSWYTTTTACGRPLPPIYISAASLKAINAKPGDKLPRGWKWQRRGDQCRAVRNDGTITAEWQKLAV